MRSKDSCDIVVFSSSRLTRASSLREAVIPPSGCVHCSCLLSSGRISKNHTVVSTCVHYKLLPNRLILVPRFRWTDSRAEPAASRGARMTRHRDPEGSVLTFWRTDDRILRSRLRWHGWRTDRAVEGIRLQALTPASCSPLSNGCGAVGGWACCDLCRVPSSTRLLLMTTTTTTRYA